MDEKDNSKPLYSFNNLLPIKHSISGKQEFLEKLERYCESKKTNKTEITNKIILDELKINGINDFEELAKQVGIFQTLNESFKQSLNQFLGCSNLSKFIRDRLEKKWQNEKFI